MGVRLSHTLALALSFSLSIPHIRAGAWFSALLLHIYIAVI